MMKQVLLLFTFLTSTCLLFASILDQSQDQYHGLWFTIGADRQIAQTFTPSTTGQLQSVSIKFGNMQDYANNIPLYPIDVSIVETVDSVPSGATLGTVHISAFEADFTSVDFSGLSIFLNENIQYAIIVTNDDPTPYDQTSTQWQASFSDPYAGGSAWVWVEDLGWITEYIPEGETTPLETYYNKDLAFQTYMAPEPATMALLGFGTFLLRKRK